MATLIHTFEGHTGEVKCCSFASKSNYLASVSADKNLRLWDITERRQLQLVGKQAELPLYSVKSCTFSPLGSTLAAVAGDASIILCDLENGDEVKSITCTFVIKSLKFSLDNLYLAGVSSNGTVCVWDVTSGALLQMLGGLSSSITCCCFTFDNSYIACGSADGLICMWGLNRGSMEGHSTSAPGITGCDFSPTTDDTGQLLLATCGEDCMVKLWTVRTPPASASCAVLFQKALEGHKENVWKCIFSANGKILVSCSSDTTVIIWDPTSGAIISQLCAHSSSISALSLSPDGKLMATGSKDKMVKVWSIDALYSDDNGVDDSDVPVGESANISELMKEIENLRRREETYKETMESMHEEIKVLRRKKDMDEEFVVKQKDEEIERLEAKLSEMEADAEIKELEQKLREKQKDQEINRLQKKLLGTMRDEKGSVGKSTEDLFARKSSVQSSPASSTSGRVEDDVLDLAKKYAHLEEDKNRLYGYWKTVTNQRDDLQKEVEELRRWKTEVSERDILQEEDEQFSLKSRFLGERIVQLQRNKSGKFGLQFGEHTESKTIVIANCSPEVSDYYNISKGDWVLEVNGINVQYTPPDDVMKRVPKTDNIITIKLRSRANVHEISGRRHLADDWGASFGLYVKEVKANSYASQRGFVGMDEIVKINSRTIDIALNDVLYGRMKNKEVVFKVQRLRHYNDRRSSMSSYGSRSVTSSTQDLRELPPYVPTSRPTPPRPIEEAPPSVISSSSFESSNRKHVASDGSAGNIESPSSGSACQSGSMSESSQYNSSGSSGKESDVTIKVVTKKSFETIGWTLIGGNKVGIFVESVNHWSPASTALILEGWKVIEVEGMNFTNIAYSFAMDFMESLSGSTEITMKFKMLSNEAYRSEIAVQPHDSFHVQTLVDYKSSSRSVSSFQVGSIFHVTDSYHTSQSGELYWKATSSTSDRPILIPRQYAMFKLNEYGVYEYGEHYGTLKPSKKRPVAYYKILEDVDIGNAARSMAF